MFEMTQYVRVHSTCLSIYVMVQIDYKFRLEAIPTCDCVMGIPSILDLVKGYLHIEREIEREQNMKLKLVRCALCSVLCPFAI